MAKDEMRPCQILQIMRELSIESEKCDDGQPITPIPREETAFNRMSMDLVGPSELAPAAGHK